MIVTSWRAGPGYELRADSLVKSNNILKNKKKKNFVENIKNIKTWKFESDQN